MRYEEARGSIQTGDVLAWTHRGIKSWYDFKVWLVRLFQMSEYTHVAVAWVTSGRVFMLESTAVGVRIFPTSLEVPFYHIPWLPLSEAQLDFALSQAGKPYSNLDCALEFLGVDTTDSGKWECAKYVKAIHRLTCSATPSAVVDYLLAAGATLREVQP